MKGRGRLRPEIGPPSKSRFWHSKLWIGMRLVDFYQNWTRALHAGCSSSTRHWWLFMHAKGPLVSMVPRQRKYPQGGVKYQKKALSFLYRIISTSMVANCSFAFFCGRQCREWQFSLDASCQTRPAMLCKQCSPTPNWGSSDRPLKALHEATHRREKIRGPDTSLWPGLRAGLIKVLFSFKADPILTEEAIFELYYDTDSESA